MQYCFSTARKSTLFGILKSLADLKTEISIDAFLHNS